MGRCTNADDRRSKVTSNPTKPANEVNSGNENFNFIGNGDAIHQYNAGMPINRHASEYNMKHKQRGLALIFNHENFDNENLKKRTGTRVDCKLLLEVLKPLGFEVIIHNDCLLNVLMQHIESAASRDHTNSDCILIVILSHGEKDGIWAKDQLYKLQKLWAHFTASKCPSLADKPKLFFIQACQGRGLDGGVEMRIRTEADGDDDVDPCMPTQTDFLIAYSTIPGYFSWRNKENGSWFMQSLCKGLEANGKLLDILTLLTFVCQRVAFDFESCTPNEPEKHKKKQIPRITSTLTRILRFNNKSPAPAGAI